MDLWAIIVTGSWPTRHKHCATRFDLVCHAVVMPWFLYREVHSPQARLTSVAFNDAAGDEAPPVDKYEKDELEGQ